MIDSLSSGGVLGLFLKLAGVLLVFLADLVKLPHVLEEIGASLKSDEKLGLLAVASVVRSLNCNGLCPDLRECGVIVPIQTKKGSVIFDVTNFDKT